MLKMFSRQLIRAAGPQAFPDLRFLMHLSITSILKEFLTSSTEKLSKYLSNELNNFFLDLLSDSES